MPKCNICDNSFDVEKKPGALLFSHPTSVKKICKVKKYHICQKCEKRILSNIQSHYKSRRLSAEDLQRVMLDWTREWWKSQPKGAKYPELNPIIRSMIAHAIAQKAEEIMK